MSELNLIAPELLEIMQCPSCGGELVERLDLSALVCGECHLAYPVRDGIPVMLVEEATPAEES